MRWVRQLKRILPGQGVRSQTKSRLEATENDKNIYGEYSVTDTLGKCKLGNIGEVSMEAATWKVMLTGCQV